MTGWEILRALASDWLPSAGPHLRVGPSWWAWLLGASALGPGAVPRDAGNSRPGPDPEQPPVPEPGVVWLGDGEDRCRT